MEPRFKVGDRVVCQGRPATVTRWYARYTDPTCYAIRWDDGKEYGPTEDELAPDPLAVVDALIAQNQIAVDAALADGSAAPAFTMGEQAALLRVREALAPKGD